MFHDRGLYDSLCRSRLCGCSNVQNSNASLGPLQTCLILFDRLNQSFTGPTYANLSDMCELSSSFWWGAILYNRPSVSISMLGQLGVPSLTNSCVASLIHDASRHSEDTGAKIALPRQRSSPFPAARWRVPMAPMEEAGGAWIEPKVRYLSNFGHI